MFSNLGLICAVDDQGFGTTKVDNKMGKLRCWRAVLVFKALCESLVSHVVCRQWKLDLSRVQGVLEIWLEVECSQLKLFLCFYMQREQLGVVNAGVCMVYVQHQRVLCVHTDCIFLIDSDDQSLLCCVSLAALRDLRLYEARSWLAVLESYDVLELALVDLGVVRDHQLDSTAA